MSQECIPLFQVYIDATVFYKMPIHLIVLQNS